MKSFLWALALLPGLAACHSQTQPTTEPASTTDAGKTPARQEVVADSPGAAYHEYRALLPGQADSVTLHLVTAPQPRYDTHGPSTQSSYYGADGHPYDLASQPSAPDSLVLNDYSPEHSSGPNGQGPVWRLKKQPDGSLTGTANGQAVRLRLVRPTGALTFAVRCFTDSLAAYPKKPTASPKARIYLQTLVPAGSSATVRQAVADNISRELRGDTLNRLPAITPASLFTQQRDTFYKEYREQVAELAPAADTNDPDAYRATLNYEDQRTTYVLYHQGNLLSLGFFSYTYLGGAHGMNTTRGASYDLRTGQRLRYDDIFLPTAATHLPALLEKAVRPLVGLKPGEALDQQLFVTRMPVTHNVFLTAGGVEFIYQPYEIASYAQGEVRVFIPLAQVRSLLREGLPLPGAGSVVAR